MSERVYWENRYVDTIVMYPTLNRHYFSKKWSRFGTQDRQAYQVHPKMKYQLLYYTSPTNPCLPMNRSTLSDFTAFPPHTLVIKCPFNIRPHRLLRHFHHRLQSFQFL
jgi:hypothetical protein